MASVAGPSSDAFFWVASRMKVSDRITSSSARIDFLRPTKRGAMMCGNTTTRRRYCFNSASAVSTRENRGLSELGKVTLCLDQMLNREGGLFLSLVKQA